MRKRVLIVADDLTGAADAAVAFAEQGYTAAVPLRCGARGAEAADVLAVSTESRDLQPFEMRERLRVLTDRRDGRDVLFKKVDSMFRGNTFAEIAEAMRLAPEAAVMIAPAFPALGRRCIGGNLHWSDAAGDGMLQVRAELRKHGVETESLQTGVSADELVERLRSHAAQGRRVFLKDAHSESDLENVVQAAMEFGGPMLWVGSAGLARALSAHLAREDHIAPRAAEVQRGKVLYFVGSDHPVTQLQVEQLRRDPGYSPEALVAVPRGIATKESVHGAVSGIDARDVGCAFITGGDTATLVLGAIGAEFLSIEREVAPGVPLGRIHAGQWDGVPVVLKSGGFGQPELLCRIQEMFGKSERGAA